MELMGSFLCIKELEAGVFLCNERDYHEEKMLILPNFANYHEENVNIVGVC